MRRYAIVVTAVALVLLALLLRGLGAEPDARTVTVIDTVENTELRARLAAYQREYARAMTENSGLLGTVQELHDRIRGLEARAPDTVLVATDPVDVSRDTLARPTIAVEGGIARYAVLIPRADSLHEERLLAGVNVRDCDDGFVLGPQGAACNRAALGHLKLFMGAGVTAHVRGDSLRSLTHRDLTPVGMIGARWEQCFRCALAIQATIETTGRASLGAEWGLRLF